jgi:hypothetical protein
MLMPDLEGTADFWSQGTGSAKVLEKKISPENEDYGN